MLLPIGGWEEGKDLSLFLIDLHDILRPSDVNILKLFYQGE